MSRTTAGQSGHSSRSASVSAFYDRLVNGTLPMFARHGWDDGRGGLVERLEPGPTPDRTRFRRSMVHGRQLFVFSLWGGRLGERTFVEYADRIFGYLTDRFADRDCGGWHEKVDLGGGLLSADKVLYSHAFVLLGLAAYRHCRGGDDGGHLDRTLDYIEARFRSGDGLYRVVLDREGRDIGESVDQNPMMHLLEALLFLFERSGRPEALALAGRIVQRVRQCFLVDGMILEHLGRDLRPHPDKGHLVEPGHQAEWAWLLNWYSVLAGTDEPRRAGRMLLENGLRVGWDSGHGGLFDQIDRTGGTVTMATKRLWPLGELIKAAAVFPDCVEPAGLGVDALVRLLCRRYLRADGTWSERLHRDMTVADPGMPASSCYHLSFALAEALGSAGPPRGGARYSLP